MTQEEIRKAVNALLCCGTFEMQTNGYDISVHHNRMFVDESAIARVNGNKLFVTVVNNRNKTTIELLNALPNVNIKRDEFGTFYLNEMVWIGGWHCAVDDLYKHDEDL